MSRMWHKKNEILRLLERRPMTISEISRELDLAVSTTSQHVGELRGIGAVMETSMGHSRKWRYYRLNPEFQVDDAIKLGNDGARMGRTGMFLGAAAVIVLIGIILFAIYRHPSNAILFSLTDPPTVPRGTQALIINYSSLEAHVVGPGNTTGWVSGYGNGTLDLLGLVNSSRIIGLTNVADGRTVDMVRFNINSAKIVINGTAYNVSVPNGQVTADIGTYPEQRNPEEVLIDLFPSVVTEYNGNTTSFSLLVDVKAIAQPQTNPIRFGMIMGLKHKQAIIFRNLSNDVYLSNATILQQDNSTYMAVSLSNQGNQSIVIKHIIVVDMKDIAIGGNATTRPPPPVEPFVLVMNRVMPQGQTDGQGVRPVTYPIDRFRMLNYVVNSNGTLEMQQMPMQEFVSGYILNPGENTTLTFRGNITFGNGAVRIMFTKGANYKIVVVGSGNTFVVTNAVFR